MKTVLILGANSLIAKCYARLLIKESAEFIFAARDAQKLKILEDDITARGGKILYSFAADLADTASHADWWQKIQASLAGKKLDEVLIAYGVLPKQEECEKDFALQVQTYNINVLSVMSWLTLMASYFAAQGQGQISVISSVAGDIGRRSNYVYGSTKAAISAYLQGFRGAMFAHNVRVLTIKPGFVDTPMVDAYPKNFLYASPERVAKGILRATKSGKDVSYLPSFWWFILTALQHLPERVRKRLKF